MFRFLSNVIVGPGHGLLPINGGTDILIISMHAVGPTCLREPTSANGIGTCPDLLPFARE